MTTSANIQDCVQKLPCVFSITTELQDSFHKKGWFVNSLHRLKTGLVSHSLFACVYMCINYVATKGLRGFFGIVDEGFRCAAHPSLWVCRPLQGWSGWWTSPRGSAPLHPIDQYAIGKIVFIISFNYPLYTLHNITLQANPKQLHSVATAVPQKLNTSSIPEFPAFLPSLFLFQGLNQALIKP